MSKSGSPSSELLDVLQEIEPHSHLALIYEDKEEQFAAAVPAIRIGIDRREKCVYVADDNTTRDVIDALRDGGIDIDAAVESGSLTVATRQNTTLKEGHFVPETLLRFWADAADAATADGFSGLRIVAEMTWALGGHPGTERLIEFEAKLNDLVRTHPIVGICQYNRARFSPEVILNVIRIHPLVFFEGLVCRNPYYIPPREFLGPHQAEVEVERLLGNIREWKQAEEQLDRYNHLLQSFSRRLVEVQEEERRHLARELHDEIGQTLNAAMLNLKIIAQDAPVTAAGRLEDSIQLLDRLLTQVRQLSLDLRPPLLDELGLVPALRWLVDQQSQRAQLRMSFRANVEELGIDPAVQTACFRVAQEAITNTIRHARAKKVSVELRAEADRLWLSVRDDGVGFDPALIQQGDRRLSSLGLVSMKERALLVCGGLEIHSAPGQGTEIRGWFPRTAHESRTASESR